MRKIIKQRKWAILAFSMAVLIFSCQKKSEDGLLINNETEENYVDESYVSSLTENLFYSDVADTDGTKKAAKIFKKIKSIDGVTDEESKNLFYIVNYKGGGFAVIAADDRVFPLLAYSDKNSFDLDRKFYSEGLEQWLSDTKKYIKAVRKANKKQTEEMAQAWLPCPLVATIRDEPIDECEPCEDSYVRVDPLLQTTWGQWDGYNDFCPYMDCSASLNGRVPTGCVATAMAQIMKYHEYPTNYNWSAMPNTTGSTEIARLMYDIGGAVNMDYGCEGSGAYSLRAALAFMDHFGYSLAVLSNYNHTTVKNELRYNRPVYLRGDFHAWVCDGYISTYHCDIGINTLYFHMNWGWDNQYNAWYAYNNFNPADRDYNSNRMMITNIKP